MFAKRQRKREMSRARGVVIAALLGPCLGVSGHSSSVAETEGGAIARQAPQVEHPAMTRARRALASASGTERRGYKIGITKRDGLRRLGPMRLAKKARRSPPYMPRWTLAFAIKRFGDPKSRRETPQDHDPGCIARWPNLGLKLAFSHVHYTPEGHSTVCRRPKLSHLGSAFFRGRAARRAFVTDRGVTVGTTVERLRRRYPQARRFGRYWQLEQTFAFDQRLTTLAARTSGGRVVSLAAHNVAD